MEGQAWEVVGGQDKGGILVRQGRDLSSAAETERLSFGAIVEELELLGERLHYKIIKGTGPVQGWCSTKLKDKELLKRKDEGAQAPPVKAAASKSAPAKTAPAKAAPKAQPAAQPAVQPEKPQEPKAAPAAKAPEKPMDYASRIEALREEFPGFEKWEQIPYEARNWTPQELRNYVESDGFIKPQKYQHSVPKAKPKEDSKVTEQRAKILGPQMNTNEFLSMQDQMLSGFRDKEWQAGLLALQTKYSNRKTRGHPDGLAFFEQFEVHVMKVYKQVLPKFKLSGDWDGITQMYAMTVTARMHPKVKKQMEDINTLQGLPRDAMFTPAKKSADLFRYCPERDGEVPGYPLALVTDEEGDEAHAFLVESSASGELEPQGPNALDSDCWFRVVVKPCVMIRDKPDVKGKVLGKKDFGKKLHVQKVVHGKWCLLHASESSSFGGKEAWAPIGGKEGPATLERC